MRKIGQLYYKCIPDKCIPEGQLGISHLKHIGLVPWNEIISADAFLSRILLSGFMDPALYTITHDSYCMVLHIQPVAYPGRALLSMSQLLPLHVTG